MKTSRITGTDKNCETCTSWGDEGDKGTFRKCMITDEHVSCSDTCKLYTKKEDEVTKGED